MSTLKNFIFLSLFLLSLAAMANSDNLKLFIGNSAIENILFSALEQMEGKNDGKLRIQEGMISHSIDLRSEEFKKLNEVLSSLFTSTNFYEKVNAFVQYGPVEIKAKLNEKETQIQFLSNEENQITIYVKVAFDNLVIKLDKLYLCTEKNCKRDNFLKFKNLFINIGAATQNLKLGAKISFKLNDADNGLTKGNVSISQITTNLNTFKYGQNFSMSYLGDKYQASKQYPELSRIIVGSEEFNFGLTRDDLIRELELHKSALGENILKVTALYLKEQLGTTLNSFLKESGVDSFILGAAGSYKTTEEKQTEATKEVPSFFNPIYVAQQDNTRVVLPPIEMFKPNRDIGEILLNMTRSLDYASSLSSLATSSDKSKLYAKIQSDLYLNNNHLETPNLKGYGSCSSNKYKNCLQKLPEAQFNSTTDHNFGFSVSESLLNGILKLAYEEGQINAILNEKLGIPGVSVSQDGIKVHTFRNKLYVIVNVQVSLKEQAEWTSRNIGTAIEKVWGNTGGIIKFPLEIPVELSVSNKGGRSLLHVLAQSPIKGDATYNEHGYPSNLNDTASTWLVKIKSSIVGSFYDGIKEFLDTKTAPNGRTYFKKIDMDITDYLKDLPMDFIPTEIKAQSTGHIQLYGKIKGLRMNKILK